MRGWIAEQANYQEPVPLGAVMTGFTVGEVIASDHPDYAVGDLVMGGRGRASRFRRRISRKLELDRCR